MHSLPTPFELSKPENYTHELVLQAPVTGEINGFEILDDPLLNAGIWGHGVAIRTRSTQCISPISGKVIKVDIGQQRWTLLSKNGLKLAIQIGPVTAPIYGERLTVHKRDGQTVVKGEALVQFDPLYLQQTWGHCYCILTVMNKKAVKAIVTEPPGTKVTSENAVVRIYI